MQRTDQRPSPAPGSLWQDDPRLARREHRPPLGADLDVDAAIVGGGLTGLWTAYHLAVADPSLRIAVLERQHVGFGASGRNGGWCSGLLPVGLDRLDRLHGPGAGRRLQRAMFDTVAEVLQTCATEQIDADQAHGGWVALARNPAQVDRLRAELATYQAHGFADDITWLSRDEALERVAATDVLGGLFTPHCAAVQPALLVAGLADAVERRGVQIFERTPVVAFEEGGVRSLHHRVRAAVVLQATEAYGRDLAGQRRQLVPVYSMMVATEPLPARTWAAIGLDGRATFNDARREIIYGQRTADGRLAFGGRGAPYHFGSKIADAYDQSTSVKARLTATLVELFPVLRGVEITHHWGGPLGIPRDWHPSVAFDRAHGRGRAGGYVGDGVAASYLAGRTLADLVVGRRGDLAELPWVNHRSPAWEPEPLRWLGVNGALRLARLVDRAESRRGRTPWYGRVLDRLTGG